MIIMKNHSSRKSPHLERVQTSLMVLVAILEPYAIVCDNSFAESQNPMETPLEPVVVATHNLGIIWCISPTFSYCLHILHYHSCTHPQLSENHSAVI